MSMLRMYLSTSSGSLKIIPPSSAIDLTLVADCLNLASLVTNENAVFSRLPLTCSSTSLKAFFHLCSFSFIYEVRPVLKLLQYQSGTG
jgi:hypothetical protein